jgi:hypothetical protein
LAWQVNGNNPRIKDYWVVEVAFHWNCSFSAQLGSK